MEENLKEIFPEDYYDEIRGWILTRAANETLRALRHCPYLAEDRLYDFDELLEALKWCGHLRTRFGRNSLTNDLSNLWRCNRIGKFCIGFYQRNNKPYGIKWWIHKS